MYGAIDRMRNLVSSRLVSNNSAFHTATINGWHAVLGQPQGKRAGGDGVVRTHGQSQWYKSAQVSVSPRSPPPTCNVRTVPQLQLHVLPCVFKLGFVVAVTICTPPWREQIAQITRRQRLRRRRTNNLMLLARYVSHAEKRFRTSRRAHMCYDVYALIRRHAEHSTLVALCIRYNMTCLPMTTLWHLCSDYLFLSLSAFRGGGQCKYAHIIYLFACAHTVPQSTNTIYMLICIINLANQSPHTLSQRVLSVQNMHTLVTMAGQDQ